MPGEEKGIPTINESGSGASSGATGKSAGTSDGGLEAGGVFKNTGSLISTTEFEMVGDTEEGTKSPEAEKGGKEETADKGKEGEEGKDTDYSGRAGKRIQQLNDKVKAAEERAAKSEERALKLEGRLEALEKGFNQGGKEGEDKGESVKNLMDMDTDELREKLYDDPKKVIADLARQIRDEITEERTENLHQQSTQEFEAKVIKAFDDYGDQNPKFVELWDAGEIMKFIKDNPGHNAFSAFMTMTEKERIATAVAKETEKIKKDLIAQLRAKRGAFALDGSPTPPSKTPHGEVAPELKDTNKYGGRTNVLLNRLLSRRKATGMG